ncbi:metallophosphoesterase [bacterium]|nr:metallophosphoesterase [bacterium]
MLVKKSIKNKLFDTDHLGKTLVLGILFIIFLSVGVSITAYELTRSHNKLGPADAAPPLSNSYKIVAAGDLVCNEIDEGYNGGRGSETTCQMEATSNIALGLQPDAVLLLGDLQYYYGEYDYFERVYDKSWGRLKSISYPTPGNHEYGSPNAEGYFKYFDAAAGDPQKGYYRFTKGQWQIYSINSNCQYIGGCQKGSLQYNWLKAELEANPSKCTLAYWHHPLFSSGYHGNNTFMRDIWQLLEEHNTELVLAGHDHLYERFDPQTSRGKLDEENGIRQITVGTGGKSLFRLQRTLKNSLVRDDSNFGVLELNLSDIDYSWRYVVTGDQPPADSGYALCK